MFENKKKILMSATFNIMNLIYFEFKSYRKNLIVFESKRKRSIVEKLIPTVIIYHINCHNTLSRQRNIRKYKYLPAQEFILVFKIINSRVINFSEN